MIDINYYNYKPLAFKTIRLLRFRYDSPRDRENELEVDLEDASLDDVQFNALSYTWGPTTLEEQERADAQVFTTVQRCYPIRVGGQIIRVTRSLRDALLRIRALLLAPTETLYSEDGYEVRMQQLIWADGICINQDDLQERAQQVLLMTEIYSKAAVVLAYLGEPDEFSRSAILSALTLTKVAQKFTAGFRTSSASLPSDYFQMVGAQPLSLNQWWEWAILMSRSWFQRTWVLQEAVLAKSDRCICLCGNILVPYTSLITGTSIQLVRRFWVSQVAQMAGIRMTNPRYVKYWPTVSKWFHELHPHTLLGKAWAGGNIPSFYLISHSILPLTYCFDARDKIYGTLGFATEWQSPVSQDMPVDYTLSTEEVFCRATKYLIARSQSLQILTTVTVREATDKKLQLPSWCPNYARHKNEPSLLLAMDSNPNGTWYASGDSIHTVESAFNFHTIKVRGLFCGNIRSHVPAASFASGEASDCTRVLRWLLMVMSKAPHDSSHIVKSFYHALTAFGSDQKYDGNFLRQDVIDPQVLGFAMTSFQAYPVHRATSRAGLAKIYDGIQDLVHASTDVLDLVPEAINYLPDPRVLSSELQIRQHQMATADIISNGISDYRNRMPWSLEDRCAAELRLNKVCSVSRSRHLFCTATYSIGVGHETLQKDDQIWLLAGSQIPFILRPYLDKSFELIGEAYVDGMMFGELWPSDDTDLMEITLV